jgi:ABC-type glutathione transport system ATPase component
LHDHPLEMRSLSLSAKGWKSRIFLWHATCEVHATRAESWMAHAALELIHVTKRYGTTTAVEAVDLKISGGMYCCLLGPSGCGKTSTLRMIAGHEAVSEGDIIIGPGNVTDLPPARRGTAMMFQSYALFPHLSCVDNVAFSLKMRGGGKEDPSQPRPRVTAPRRDGQLGRPTACAIVGRSTAARCPGSGAHHGAADFALG